MSDDPEARGFAEASIDAIRDPELVEARRNQILDASQELFLEKGFAATTIRDIAARSGVNQASFYDYVANKQDILRRLLNRTWLADDRASVDAYLEPLKTAEDLPSALRGYIAQNWDNGRADLQMIYRFAPYLTAEDQEAVEAHSTASVEALAACLGDRMGAEGGSGRAKIVANLMIFMLSFGPLRDWSMKDVDDDVVLDVCAEAAAAVAGLLAKDD